jgi:hypothetical protein
VTRSWTYPFLAVTFWLVAACWLASCATSLGPGYIVEKQEIQVLFAPQPEPRIHVSAAYQLKNTGNQALDSLDVRLPGRRFRLANLMIWVDGAALARSTSPDNPRDTVLRFPDSWPIGASHSILFAYDIPSAPVEQGAIGFSADAFYLPAEGWTPALPQDRGVFGFGGVPPKKWELLVRVPQGFLVHASGAKERHAAKGTEMEFRFEQAADDLNPFVVAGQFREARQELPGGQKIRIWSRADLNPLSFRQAGDSLARTLAAYDSLFGAGDKSRHPLWIVECPSEAGCISQRGSGFSTLLYGAAQDSPVEMISRDTVLVDPRVSGGEPEALAAPALAAGWLGYGQNPGFYEQQLPMSALPAFAAALARENSSGPQVRAQIIARALAQIPRNAARDSNADANVSRAKSLLLFYALRDRVGDEKFQRALQHMLSARQARGFDITDLISALEQESRQAVGPFVRQWIKRPGIPDDFRAAYAN